jgi:hypothetical protein
MWKKTIHFHIIKFRNSSSSIRVNEKKPTRKVVKIKKHIWIFTYQGILLYYLKIAPLN